MRKDQPKTFEIKNMSADFEQAKMFVENILKDEKASETVSSETMLVFEALYNSAQEQISRTDTVVTIRRE